MYDIHRKTTSVPGISPFKMWEGLEELTEVQWTTWIEFTSSYMSILTRMSMLE